MLESILQQANAALQSNLTDQDISKQCPSLKAEDIHAIRQANTDLSLLPYIALSELSQIGRKKERANVLNSPIKEKEYAIFKERLFQHFRIFNEKQKEKYLSDQSQMDDLIIAKLMKNIQQDLYDDENRLLQYFEIYQNEL